MISCAVCNDYTFGRLCKDCVIIRHAMTLYGKDDVIHTLNRIFRRSTENIAARETEVLKEAAQAAVEKVRPS